MAKIDLHGIFPPIPTPFLDGQVAFEKLATNIRLWSNTGLSGFVVLGSNGEYVYLSGKEKRDIVAAVVQAAPEHMLVIAGTGCESTQESIRLTRDCARLGAHAALVVTPHYYGGKMNATALKEHFTSIADNSTIPIVLYNVPKFTHINLTVDIVAQLSEHPNIAGIKDSTGNIIQLGDFLNNVDTNFRVLVGTAAALFGGLTLGCAGGVLALANVAPEICVRIFELVKANEIETARDLQLKMIPVNNALTLTYGVPGLKAALDVRGYFGGESRRPLLPLSETEKADIRGILEKAELLND